MSRVRVTDIQCALDLNGEEWPYRATVWWEDGCSASSGGKTWGEALFNLVRELAETGHVRDEESAAALAELKGGAALRLLTRATAKTCSRRQAVAMTSPPDPLSPPEATCDHGVCYDPIAGEAILGGWAPASPVDFIIGNPASAEIRRRFPRLSGPCPKGCGFNSIAYASWEHYIAGDW